MKMFSISFYYTQYPVLTLLGINKLTVRLLLRTGSQLEISQLGRLNSQLRLHTPTVFLPLTNHSYEHIMSHTNRETLL